MKKIFIETLIIGAGPAGLAAAMELSKANKKFLVIERQSSVGGLSKTYEFREGDLVFRTDNGPHRFFSKNPYLYEFIEDLLDEHWIQVKRQTRQFIEGKFYDYPINALQALKNVGMWRAFRMGLDYGIAKVRYSLLRKPVRNFADYVHANFGKSLGEFNMINYTEKIWGMPATEIHEDWAGQRIKGLSLLSLFKDMCARLFRISGKGQPKTLVSTFYYPDLGTGLIYTAIAKRLKQKGYTIMLSTEPYEIIHDGKRQSKVLCHSPEGDVEISFNNIIESIPLKHYINLLKPSLSKDILDAQEKLRYRSQVYLFITLDQSSVTDDQWIYFPEKNNPIGRMSEMRNFSHRMSPLGKTSLFLEFFCTEGDETWNAAPEKLFETAVEILTKFGFTDRKKVRNYYLLRERDVYPIYDLPYKEYVSAIKKRLDAFENLYYIGRPGRFRYNNQDHSLEMGMLAARSIIEGTRYDIEKVGDEAEYYEQGNLHKSSRKSA